MESSGSLGPTHSHRIAPSLEETVIMLDSIDGFALWLRTEGRPKSASTVTAYCRAVRRLRRGAPRRIRGPVPVRLHAVAVVIQVLRARRRTNRRRSPPIAQATALTCRRNLRFVPRRLLISTGLVSAYRREMLTQLLRSERQVELVK
jgi:hypothetical protein